MLDPRFRAQDGFDADWARKTMALVFLRYAQVRVIAVSNAAAWKMAPGSSLGHHRGPGGGHRGTGPDSRAPGIAVHRAAALEPRRRRLEAARPALGVTVIALRPRVEPAANAGLAKSGPGRFGFRCAVRSDLSKLARSTKLPAQGQSNMQGEAPSVPPVWLCPSACAAPGG